VSEPFPPKTSLKNSATAAGEFVDQLERRMRKADELAPFGGASGFKKMPMR